MKYVAYFRVSTVRQGKSGLGLKDQEQVIFSRIKPEDEVIAQFSEIETGTNKKIRPELQKAVALCKKTKATLIVSRLDRLHRNVAAMSALLDSGIDILFCDFPGANRMTIQLIAVLAEYEAMNISRNTKAALQQAKIYGTKSGRLIGDTGGWNSKEKARIIGPYALFKRFLENNANIMAYSFIEQLTDTHKIRSKDIAGILNKNRYVTHLGHEWTSKSVNKLKFMFRSAEIKRKVREFDEYKAEIEMRHSKELSISRYAERSKHALDLKNKENERESENHISRAN